MPCVPETRGFGPLRGTLSTFSLQGREVPPHVTSSVLWAPGSGNEHRAPQERRFNTLSLGSEHLPATRAPAADGVRTPGLPSAQGSRHAWDMAGRNNKRIEFLPGK